MQGMRGIKALTAASKVQQSKLEKEINASKENKSRIHTSDDNPNDDVSKKTNTSKGGRPTNKEKGIKCRKQYTLTLKEDTYKLIIDSARLEDLSFAKFMERAALEYIENHK